MMVKEPGGQRVMAVILAVGLCLSLAACLIAPGKFTSTLDIRKDGRFTFTYTGEIHALGMAKLAEMGRDSETKKEFEPSTCYADDSGDERACTDAEQADQKTAWEDEQKSKADKQRRDAEMAKAMFGGLDPSDPKAAEEFALRLSRQTGWRSVIYKGDGLYQVDFLISGRLDHDFAFPTIERMPMANAFVTLTRRKDGSVKIDTPGFGAAGNNGMSNFFQLAALGAAMDKTGEEEGGGKSKDALPALEGQFTLTTDAEILANNTDEGPAAMTAGKRLVWTVKGQSGNAPSALVKLTQ